ncbi:unnamed protein product [uncultured virus]|nr:unnamed protein product [uncultured virus]
MQFDIRFLYDKRVEQGEQQAVPSNLNRQVAMLEATQVDMSQAM